MRVQNIILICSLFIAFSCNENKENVKTGNSDYTIDTTTIFKSYLQNIFHLSIPNEKHCFYIVSDLGCFDCTQTLFNRTIHSYKQIDTTKITFILANSKLIMKKSSKIKFLVDSFAEINELALPITNITLIYTSQKKVDSILPLKWEDQTRIIDLLKF